MKKIDTLRKKEKELRPIVQSVPTIPAHPERKLVYSSAPIQERRQRILREARRLIAEEGIDGFSIRKLCARANVVQRTLYNAFQSKDRIIALTITNAYERAHGSVQYKTDSATLEGVVDRMYTVNHENLRSRNYVKAVASLYFSPNLSDDIHRALQAMVLYQRLWLEHCRDKGGLRPGIEISAVVSDLANLEYSIIHDWSLGRIADETYLRHLLQSFLTYVFSIVMNAERKKIGKALDRLLELGDAEAFHEEIVVNASK